MDKFKYVLALIAKTVFSVAVFSLLMVIFVFAHSHQFYAAVVLVLFAQFIFQYVLSPLRFLKELIYKIGVEITFNENNLYCTSLSEGEVQQKLMTERAALQKKFRMLACELEPRAAGVMCYWLWSFLQLTPSFKNIQKARAELIGLSNSVYKDLRNINKYNREEYQHERVRKIRKCLGLPDPTKGDTVNPLSADALERLIPQD